MKVATWNVNSIRARVDHVVAWLDRRAPDVLCLQELKVATEEFPAEVFRARGYEVAVHGQRTYNGVAILSRAGLADVATGFPGDPRPQESRIVAATCGGLRVVSAYVINGEDPASEKYGWKLEWLGALTRNLASEADRGPALVVAGDLNVAPEDRDVYNPERWAGQIMCSEPERAAFRALLEVGLVDSLRLSNAGPGPWSWWDYRFKMFEKDKGLRIDHVLVARELLPRVAAVEIDRAERGRPRPSDHAPVIATLRD